MPVRPKNDPLAARLVNMRTKLKLTQKEMAAHFHVNRSTLSTWESFGPPAQGPVRLLVLIILRRLQQRYEEIRKHGAAKNAVERQSDGHTTRT